MTRTTATTNLMYPGIDIHNAGVVDEFVDILKRRALSAARLKQIADARKGFSSMLKTAGRTSPDKALTIGVTQDGKSINRVYLATRTRHTPGGVKFKSGAAMSLYTGHRSVFDEFFETQDTALRNIYTRLGGGKSTNTSEGFLHQIGSGVPILDRELRVGDRSKYSSDSQWLEFGARRMEALRLESTNVNLDVESASQELEDLIAYYWPHIAEQTVEMARRHNATIRRLTTNQKARKEYSYAEGEMPLTPDQVAKRVRLNLHVPDLSAPLVLQFNRGFLGNATCMTSDRLTEFVEHDPEFASEFTEEYPSRDAEYTMVVYTRTKLDGSSEDSVEYSE